MRYSHFFLWDGGKLYVFLYGISGGLHLITNTTTMQAKNILQADLLDILFENRNQLYGAYTLRKNYNKRLTASLGIMVALCCVFVAGTLFAGKREVQEAPKVIDLELTTEVIPPKEEALPELPPPPAPPAAPLEDVSMVRNTTPTIVADALVNPENEIPPVDVVEKSVIGDINKIGTMDDPGLAAPPVANGPGTGGTGVAIKGTGVDKLDEVFTVVSLQARFPGGTDAWRRFLEKNLNRDEPVMNGAAPGSRLTVIVSFIVDREGNVSEVKAENDPGYGTAAEAVRVIRRGPKWMPAEQNGRKVIYRQRQSITFMVDEE